MRVDFTRSNRNTDSTSSASAFLFTPSINNCTSALTMQWLKDCAKDEVSLRRQLRARGQQQYITTLKQRILGSSSPKVVNTFSQLSMCLWMNSSVVAWQQHRASTQCRLCSLCSVGGMVGSHCLVAMRARNYKYCLASPMDLRVLASRQQLQVSWHLRYCVSAMPANAVTAGTMKSALVKYFLSFVSQYRTMQMVPANSAISSISYSSSVNDALYTCWVTVDRMRRALLTRITAKEAQITYCVIGRHSKAMVWRIGTIALRRWVGEYLFCSRDLCRGSMEKSKSRVQQWQNRAKVRRQQWRMFQGRGEWKMVWMHIAVRGRIIIERRETNTFNSRVREGPRREIVVRKQQQSRISMEMRVGEVRMRSYDNQGRRYIVMMKGFIRVNYDSKQMMVAGCEVIFRSWKLRM